MDDLIKAGIASVPSWGQILEKRRRADRVRRFITGKGSNHASNCRVDVSRYRWAHKGTDEVGAKKKTINQGLESDIRGPGKIMDGRKSRLGFVDKHRPKSITIPVHSNGPSRESKEFKTSQSAPSTPA